MARTFAFLVALAVLLSVPSCAPRSARTRAAPPSAQAVPAPAPDDPLASFAWLAGTWVSEDAEGPRTVEHWLAPEGGTMLGVNRTTQGGRTVFFEYLRIEARPDGIAYLASPRGQDPPTRFAAADAGPTFAAFENGAHDFPQRIEYRREGDRLRMRISGLEAGVAKAHEWSMRRVGE